MANEFDTKGGAIVSIPFSVANAVTNQTNTDLTLAGGNTLAVMPKAGSVIGLSVKPSADVTAGTVGFRVHKAGTEFANSGYPNPTLNSGANSQGAYASIRPGALTFAAGDKVGVSYTSSTDAAPTNTNDYDVLLFVQLDGDE